MKSLILAEVKKGITLFSILYTFTTITSSAWQLYTPDGAPDLKVFQRRYPLEFDYFTSSVDAFYVVPETAP